MKNINLQNWERENHILSYDLGQRDEDRGWNEFDESIHYSSDEALPLSNKEYLNLLTLLRNVASFYPTEDMIKGYFSIQEQGRNANHFLVSQDIHDLESHLFNMQPIPAEDLKISLDSFPLSSGECEELLSLVGKVANKFPTDKVYSALYLELQELVIETKRSNSDGPAL